MLILAPRRRIGPPTLKERLADLVAPSFVIVPPLMAAAVFITWIKTWGDRLRIGDYIHVWCLSFGYLVLAITLMGMFTPGSERARFLVLGLIAFSVLALIWFWGLPLLNLVGLTKPLPITPITR